VSIDSFTGAAEADSESVGGNIPDSPFSAGRMELEAEASTWAESRVAPYLSAPFVGALGRRDDAEYTSDEADTLLSELDDELFAEAIDALVAEGSGKYLQALAGPGGSSGEFAREAPARWLAEVAQHTDRVLTELEARIGDRPLASLSERDFDEAIGLLERESGFVSPQDAQELFGFSIVNKLRKAASGAVALAKKGVAAVASLALKPVIALIRGKAAAILKLVMGKIVGSKLADRLPPALRPIALRLAKSFGVSEAETDDLIGGEALAEWFDREIAEALTTGGWVGETPGLADAGDLEHEQFEELFTTGSENAPDPLEALDSAREAFARELFELPDGRPPTEQLERFLPAVMAAKPAIRFAISKIGRRRIINVIARPIAALIEGKIGKQAAAQLSRHLAGTGLGLLGLEAEAGDTLGTEALVATAEDTVNRVLSLPAESLADELLVAAEVQEAFAEAAARNMPASVLRSDIVDTEDETEAGVWLMMPRTSGHPHYRWRKLSSIIPVRVTRPMARAVVLSGGETLERRLEESGEENWPVSAELEVYELLPGGTAGQIAAFESEERPSDALGEFAVLTEVAAAALTRNPALARGGGPAERAAGRGTRLFRLKVRGAAVRGRSQFLLRTDLSAANPRVSVRLFIGERDAHALSAHVAQRHMVQVIARVRGILDPALEEALTHRLTAMLRRRQVVLPEGRDRDLARSLIEGMLRAVAARLPEAAPVLADAARNAASGITLDFDFAFPDRAALGKRGTAEATALRITPGLKRV